MTPWFIGFGNILIRICLLLMAGWATLALLYSNLPGYLRPWIAAIFAIGSMAALVGRYSNGKTRLGFLIVCAVILVMWLRMPPSNTRNWQPDVALLPWAEIRGTSVTIHNIRNCAYRTENDYTVRHYDRTYDLTTLKTIDLSLVYWGSPRIAHTMLSFGFEGSGKLCFSAETRKQVGEEYSSIKGFFRKYELTYVIGDERDLIGLRTNYRGEQVYLYRLKESTDLVRQVFLDYLRRVNHLSDHPQWYNALTANCMTSFRINTAPYNPDARLDWRLIVNGYLDEMLYERKAIDTSLPFPELKQRSLINQRAKGLDTSPDFSALIRAGMPGAELNR